MLVFDTSVFIDLERGSLLEASFRLAFQFVVPDLLYERELKNQGGEELIRLGTPSCLGKKSRNTVCVYCKRNFGWPLKRNKLRQIISRQSIIDMLVNFIRIFVGSM